MNEEIKDLLETPFWASEDIDLACATIRNLQSELSATRERAEKAERELAEAKKSCPNCTIVISSGSASAR